MGQIVNPVVVERGLNVAFFDAYNAGSPISGTLALEVKSDGPSERYGWLGTSPTLREWTDERVPKGLRDNEFTITNANYEASMAIDRNDLEDDRYNQINVRVADMGRRAARHPDSLLTTLLANGESTACYDGQYFYDTDHSEGDSGSQSNDLTYNASSHTAVTQAEFEAAYEAAIVAMIGFKDDRGEPFVEELMFTPENLCVMVPRQLRQVALKTFNASIISQTDNIYQGEAKLIVNNRLTDGTKFYVNYVGAGMRPFVMQNRGVSGEKVKPELQGSDSHRGFNSRVWVYGIETRYAMGYGMWQYSVLTVFN